MRLFSYAVMRSCEGAMERKSEGVMRGITKMNYKSLKVVFVNVFDYFFEENKHLEKDFVLGNSETVSYKVLYENSLKVASYLKDKIGKDKNVVIISQNSVFFITVYLGILKSGNVCVPLDFSIEQENLNFIAGITESDLIFCDKKTESKLNLNKFEQVINESQFVELLQYQQISEFDNLYDSQNLAEIIFTSGSTGKPKGVMIYSSQHYIQYGFNC